MNTKTYADPAVNTFLLKENNSVVSSMMTIEQGDIIGIWNMVTDQKYQRQGYGLQLMRTIMRHHVDLGAQVFHLLSSEQGQNLYKKIGFRTIENYDSYIFNPI